MGLAKVVELLGSQVAGRKKETSVHPAWFEQATFRLEDERDNLYTIGASYIIGHLNLWFYWIFQYS